MRFIDSGIQAMKAGHKTQTRRVQNEGERLVYGHYTWGWFNAYARSLGWARHQGWRDKPDEIFCVATVLDKHGHIKWQQGRHYAIQPAGKRYGAKEVGSFLCTSLKGERLQNISEEDAIAEGIYDVAWAFWNGVDDVSYATAVLAFEGLWDGIHKKGERWAANPQVWVIGQAEFEWKEE